MCDILCSSSPNCKKWLAQSLHVWVLSLRRNLKCFTTQRSPFHLFDESLQIKRNNAGMFTLLLLYLALNAEQKDSTPHLYLFILVSPVITAVWSTAVTHGRTSWYPAALSCCHVNTCSSVSPKPTANSLTHKTWPSGSKYKPFKGTVPQFLMSYLATLLPDRTWETHRTHGNSRCI